MLIEIEELADPMANFKDALKSESAKRQYPVRLKYFFERDSFTVPDPFTDSDNYLYYLFVDKENHRYFISIVVIKKDISIKKDTWDKIRGDDIAMLEIKLEQAYEIKQRLMPKHTNNFYPFRIDGKIVGYIMHAYQICGL